MIADTVVNFLIQDSTLITLLGITAGDSKFYPNIPDLAPTSPYVTFKWSGDNNNNEHIDADRIQFIVHAGLATTKTAGEVIAKRIKVLLDVKDSIQSSLYSTDSEFYIYTSRYSGGDSLFEPIRTEWQTILYFEVQYQNKTASR